MRKAGRAVFLSQGEFAEAFEHFNKRLTISREMGNRDGEANAYGNLGILFLRQGQFKEAKEYLTKQLESAREIGARHMEEVARENLMTLATFRDPQAPPQITIRNG